MFTPILVMGGILIGIYTTTEAAIIGALYVILIEIVIYRAMKLSDLYRIIIDSAKITGVVLFLIANSFMLTYVILLSRVPIIVTTYLQPLIPNATVALLVIAGILLVTGCFLDLAPALLIFTPIIYPFALKFGISPIHLGVVIVMVLAVGLFTPPVGQTLYISALIAGAPIEVVSRDVLWFIGSIVIVVAMVIFINPITMWLAAF